MVCDEGRNKVAPMLNRRELLRASGGALTLAYAGRSWANSMPAQGERAVILLSLVGGPSQLETWDPKPDAPEAVRGPFRSIPTSVPGVRFCEHLPQLARRMNQLTLIRSMNHDASPIHESGHQLIHTGRLAQGEGSYPHFGSVVARLLGSHGSVPPFVMVPGPIGHTGVSISHGQSAGTLGREFDPLSIRPGEDRGTLSWAEGLGLRTEQAATRDAYGNTEFGRHCLYARKLVEAGVKVVAVNMYQSVFNQVSWDCHGARPFTSLADYASTVLPTFDRAVSALLDDLQLRGRLDSTLVVATGEFGRTPHVNAAGGRDHWPGVWSALLAGGGIAGGQVIGRSDSIASSPADRPVSPAELVATMYQSFGINPTSTLGMTDGASFQLVEEARPLIEAFV